MKKGMDLLVPRQAGGDMVLWRGLIWGDCLTRRGARYGATV